MTPNHSICAINRDICPSPLQSFVRSHNVEGVSVTLYQRSIRNRVPNQQHEYSQRYYQYVCSSDHHKSQITYPFNKTKEIQALINRLSSLRKELRLVMFYINEQIEDLREQEEILIRRADVQELKSCFSNVIEA